MRGRGAAGAADRVSVRRVADGAGHAHARAARAAARAPHAARAHHRALCAAARILHRAPAAGQDVGLVTCLIISANEGRGFIGIICDIS